MTSIEICADCESEAVLVVRRMPLGSTEDAVDLVLISNFTVTAWCSCIKVLHTIVIFSCRP